MCLLDPKASLDIRGHLVFAGLSEVLSGGKIVVFRMWGSWFEKLKRGFGNELMSILYRRLVIISCRCYQDPITVFQRRWVWKQRSVIRQREYKKQKC